jgi:hypothetical protein
MEIFMKILMILGLILGMAFFSSVTFACANFSGSFMTDTGARYKISQADCLSMEMIDDQSAVKITFDQKEQLIYDLPLEGEVAGRLNVFIISRLEGEKWVYDERKIKIHNDGKIETELSWSEVALNKESDLVTTLHHSDGVIEVFVDKRIF